MKFSGNGLYIEEYLKCANCGYLIYEADLDKSIKVGSNGFAPNGVMIGMMKERKRKKKRSNKMLS